MFKLNSKLFAMAAFVCSAGLAMAQDSKTLIDVLIQKGILNQEEAAKIQQEITKTASASQSKTVISGRIYVDVSDVSAKTDAGVKVDPSGFGTDVKRFYLGVTHQFDNMWSYNINTDSGYSSGTGATSTYIKTAYVQAKFSPEAIVQIGSANEPWIPFVEDAFTLRYVEKTITDRLGVGNSADWGVHFLGTNNMVSYNFAMVNGGGYKNPSRTNSVDWEGRVSIEPTKGLVFAVGGYSGYLGKDSNAAPAKQKASRVSLLAAYSTSKLNLGLEYFTEDNWGNTTGVASDSGDGYSAWGQYKFDKIWSVFGRYEHDQLSKDLHPSLRDNAYILGVQYAAIKGVMLSLVYKNDNIDHPTSASTVTNYSEIGMYSEIRF